MSLPVEKIYCDRCDFRSNTMVTWGNYSYRLADGREVSLYRTLGWCHACNDIVPIENLSDRERVEEGILELEAKIKTSEPAGLARWLPWKRNMARYEQQYWQAELTEALSRRLFFSQRQSPPRCLKCAATEIIPLKYVTPAVGDPPARINFVHPICGGSFWIVSDGLRIAMRFPKTLFYDNQGRSLDIESVG